MWIKGQVIPARSVPALRQVWGRLGQRPLPHFGVGLSLQSGDEGSRSLALFTATSILFGVTLSASLTSALIVHFYGSEYLSPGGPWAPRGLERGKCGNLSPVGKGEDPFSKQQTRNAAEGWSWFCQNINVPPSGGACRPLFSPCLPAGLSLPSGCLHTLQHLPPPPPHLGVLKDPGYNSSLGIGWRESFLEIPLYC